MERKEKDGDDLSSLPWCRSQTRILLQSPFEYPFSVLWNPDQMVFGIIQSMFCSFDWTYILILVKNCY